MVWDCVDILICFNRKSACAFEQRQFVCESENSGSSSALLLKNLRNAFTLQAVSPSLTNTQLETTARTVYISPGNRWATPEREASAPKTLIVHSLVMQEVAQKRSKHTHTRWFSAYLYHTSKKETLHPDVLPHTHTFTHIGPVENFSQWGIRSSLPDPTSVM